jgi:hypothetical protein
MQAIDEIDLCVSLRAHQNIHLSQQITKETTIATVAGIAVGEHPACEAVAT